MGRSRSRANGRRPGTKHGRSESRRSSSPRSHSEKRKHRRGSKKGEDHNPHHRLFSALPSTSSRRPHSPRSTQSGLRQGNMLQEEYNVPRPISHWPGWLRHSFQLSAARIQLGKGDNGHADSATGNHWLNRFSQRDHMQSESVAHLQGAQNPRDQQFAAYNYGIQSLRQAKGESTDTTVGGVLNVRKKRSKKASDRKITQNSQGKQSATEPSKPSNIIANKNRHNLVKRQADYTLSQNWTYKGCAPTINLVTPVNKTNFTSPVFQMLSTTLASPGSKYAVAAPGAMSVNMCLEICTGYQFAGLENGTICHCDDLKWTGGATGPDSGGFRWADAVEENCSLICEDSAATFDDCLGEVDNCPMTCSPNQCCGGYSFVSVYKRIALGGDLQATSVGCFHIGNLTEVKGPALWGKSNFYWDAFNKWNGYRLDELPPDQVNVNTCLDYCKTFNYAGLWNDGNCVCGNYINSSILYSDSDCNMTCAAGGERADCLHFGCDAATGCGGTGQCCGAEDKVSIYKLYTCFDQVRHTQDVNWFVGAFRNSQTDVLYCSEGYELLGDSVLQCDANQQYTSALPQCVTCTIGDGTIPGYTLPDGTELLGHVVGDSNVEVGSNVSFACENPELQILVGSITVTCQTPQSSGDDQFDQPLPHCAPRPFNASESFPLTLDINLLSFEQRAAFEDLLKKYGMGGESYQTAINGTSSVEDAASTLLMNAKATLEEILTSTPHDVVRFAAPNTQELVPFCTFDERLCPKSAFGLLKHGIYGQCHVFNNVGNLTATRPGRNSGLFASIHSDTREYLFTSDTMGGKLLLHENFEVPLPELHGLSLAKGFHYNIPFRKERANLIDTNCHRSDGTYSYQVCLQNCSALSVFTSCQCTDGRYTAPLGAEDAPMCNRTDTCYQYAISHAPGLSQCKECKRECSMVQFRTSVSASRWPIAETSLKGFCPLAENGTGSCISELRNGLLTVNVYHEMAYFEEHSERLVVSASTLYNRVSNAVSIWLGISWISVVELILAAIERKMLKIREFRKK